MINVRDNGSLIMNQIFNLLPRSLRPTTRNQIREMVTLLKYKQGLIKARKYRKNSDLKLHLGCGNNIKKDWINIDLNKSADIQLDMREKLPFSNNSCSIIYSEHFLEHIDYPEPVTTLLKECYRILKPGGTLSLSVPDINLVLQSYVNGGTSEYYETLKRVNPPWCETHMEHINYIFRQANEHLFCYDFETLKKVLEKCKFNEVRQRKINPTLDSNKYLVGSLYMEAFKPIVPK